MLLAEGVDRSISLRDLEAQYHRLQLDGTRVGRASRWNRFCVRYTGSCRALTNRIPASNAAILSALAAKGVAATLDGSYASITIWTLSPVGEVRRIHRVAAAVSAITCRDFDITYDAALIENLSAMRREALPNETGGVLLGIVDRIRQSIHIAHALPPPDDSVGSPAVSNAGLEPRGASECSVRCNATSAPLRGGVAFASGPYACFAERDRLCSTSMAWTRTLR